MTPREQGFLLLTSHLGDPQRRPLTQAELRNLTAMVRTMDRPGEDRELTEGDLVRAGCAPVLARRAVELLDRQDLLEYYLSRGRRGNCVPLTRISAGYPSIILERLGLTAPGCLWAKGDLSLLAKPAVALVGSRDLLPPNREFAREVGRQAARQGYVLISGNARGADQAAQSACLEAGGQVISVVADELERHRPRTDVLYLSEEDFDQGFTSQRALSRNRIIHCLGQKTFVAQSGRDQGGTWAGTTRNLREGWSPVYCFDDRSEGALGLAERGGEIIGLDDLTDFGRLPMTFNRLF